jgi:hypothetical protein
MSPFIKKYKRSNQEIAQILERFLEGKDQGEWDGFTLGMTFDDEEKEKIRIRCLRLSEEFPPSHPNEYCNEHGRKVIRDYIEQLRTRPEN